MYFDEKFIFRIPMLPASEFNGMDKDEINKKISDPLISEAIYLASPELYSQIDKLLRGEIDDPKKINQIYNSAYKYIARMHHRSTPFGLFAKVGVGLWSENNKTKFSKNFIASVQIDMDLLFGIHEKLLEIESIRKSLFYKKNTTLIKLTKKYRYVEYHYNNNRRIHDIVDIKRFKILDKLILMASSPLSYQDLVEYAIKTGAAKSESENFLDTLIKSQILVSTIEPSTIGENGLIQLINNLKSIKSDRNENLTEIIFLLESILDSLNRYENDKTYSVKIFNKYINELSSILIKPSESSFIQINSYDNESVFCLNKNDQREFLNLIFFLNKVTPFSNHSNLNRFRDNFVKEYEGQMIPLLMALDTELGIGYKGKDTNGLNEFVDDLKLPPKYSSNAGFSELQSVLLKIFIRGIKEGKDKIQICEDDFTNIDYQTDSLPDTIPIIFRKLSQGKYYIQNIGGGSAANLIGRFAQESIEINNVLQKIVSFEQDANKDFILAEISHLPEKRTGNILRRPRTFNYEIPYLASPSSSATRKISLDDLYVSVKNNQIVLWSKSQKKQIIPRLSTAHNFTSRSLPVYNFLCDLQFQYFRKSYLGLNWSMLNIDADFFPRLEFGDFVLSRAKWIIKKGELSKQIVENEDALSAWFKKKKIPKCFYIIENDNELFIDLSLEIAKRVFLKHLTSFQITIIEEYLPYEKSGAKNGDFWANEIISIIYNTKREKAYPITADKLVSKPQRNFLPGDEWFYIKIYAGFKSIDNIITIYLPSLLKTLKKNGLCDEFFFIRFTDPDLHIRIRFKINKQIDNNNLLNYINDFAKSLSRNEYVSNFLIDTYKREIERYGNKSVEICEKIFCIDSQETISFLIKNKNSYHSELNTILYMLLCMDYIISFSLDNDSSSRENFINERILVFEKEIYNSKDILVRIDDKYRKIKNNINSIFSECPPNELNFIVSHFKSKRNKLKNELSRLKVIYPDFSDANYNIIIGSLIHMMVNRAFKSKQRLYEHLLYSFLKKHGKTKFYLSKNFDIK